MYIRFFSQPKMLLITGPNKNHGSSSSGTTRSVLVLEGHHSVPKKLKSTLTSGFLIGHEKKDSTPFDHSINSQSNGRKKNNQSITKILGSIKDHQNIVYMFFASVGIPLFIIFLCYFEVSYFVSAFYPFFFSVLVTGVFDLYRQRKTILFIITCSEINISKAQIHCYIFSF